MKNYNLAVSEEPLVASSFRKQYKYNENDPDYKGKPLAEDLTSGIIQSRGCTDLLFFIIFVAFWVGMVIIAVMAFKSGQPNRLASPFDTDGVFYH